MLKKVNNMNFLAILKVAMNVPGVQIERDNFLKCELSKYFSNDVVNLAIQKNPASAGITINQIEDIAKNCINYETNKVTLVSAVAGMPGGLVSISTLPVDITQYFAHIIRILQKLVYLYGWQELYNSKGEFDDETTNKFIIFIGVMLGVNAANTIVTKLAERVARNIEKSLANKALTKGVVYPIVKKIAQKIGIKMTKQIFAKSVGKIVPIVSGGLSGALTYATFKASANRLQKYLKGLPTADINFYKKNNEKSNDVIDVEFS